MQRTIITPPERSRFLARARELRAHYQAAGCHFWVFEERDLSGAFIEFAEGPTAEQLAIAHASATEPLLRDPHRIYREVEL
jgi:hypothetical protein